MTLASVNGLVALDNSQRSKMSLVTTILPLVTGIVGVIVLIVGILLSRRPREDVESGASTTSPELAAAEPEDADSALRHAALPGPGLDDEPTAESPAVQLEAVQAESESAEAPEAEAAQPEAAQAESESAEARDGHPADLVRQKEEVFAKSNTPFSYRSRADIFRFFEGFELVEPGLTYVTTWRGDVLDEKMNAAGQWWLGGVGRKIGS